HETRDCPQKSSTGQESRQCANCEGAHAAWSKGCRKYAEEVDKVQAASCYRQRYHRIPPYLQDFRRDSESSGSDSTAVPSASTVTSETTPSAAPAQAPPQEPAPAAAPTPAPADVAEEASPM
ncbi:hypothetical protein BJX96DRAFT_180630, partial [Aspergillus floccosus]